MQSPFVYIVAGIILLILTVAILGKYKRGNKAGYYYTGTVLLSISSAIIGFGVGMYWHRALDSKTTSSP